MLGPTISVRETYADYYVRLTDDDLKDLCLDLLWAESPDTRDEKSLGYVEFSGLWHDAVVSVAFFWRSFEGGIAILPDPLDVSTNLMLVDSKGYDAGTKGTALALMRMIQSRETAMSIKG